MKAWELLKDFLEYKSITFKREETMKKYVVLLASLVVSQLAHASDASDPKYTYCDKISVLDNLKPTPEDWDLKRIKEDGFKTKRVVVSKSRAEVYLISDDGKVIFRPVVFGSAYTEGPKRFEGDNKTPEGIYKIDYKLDLGESQYRRALHISYPNAADVAYAKSQGKSAGGAVMIHGSPNDERKRQGAEAATYTGYNWTQGCVAVTNAHIDMIYALVPDGTLIEICGIPGKSTYTPPSDTKTVSVPAK